MQDPQRVLQSLEDPQPETDALPTVKDKKRLHKMQDLWLAIEQKQTERALEIIDAGNQALNLEDVSDDRRTALHKAAIAGNDIVCEKLLNSGANVDIRNKYEWTPLMYAVVYGHLTLVKIFISSGANVNALNSEKWSSVHLAAKFGYTEIIKMLVVAGSLKNELTNKKYTALDLAVEHQKKATVKYMVGQEFITQQKH